MTREVNTDYVAPASFAHYVVRVSDKAKSIKWYETVLGMKVVHENPMIAFMTYDDEHHRMAMVQVKIDYDIERRVTLLIDSERTADLNTDQHFPIQ